MFKTNPNGWKPWYYVRTVMNGYTVPYGSFPPAYVPTDKFWAQAMAIHCDLQPPWYGFSDAASAFENSGGNSGSIIGSLGGLAAVAQQMAIPTTANWGIGANGGDARYAALTSGYCIGDSYQEKVYFRLIVQRVAQLRSASIINSQMFSDVFQRAKLKRIYLQHGEITGFTSNGSASTSTISLDVNEKLSDAVLTANKSTDWGAITIIPSNSKAESATYKIKKVDSNFTLTVESSGTNVSNVAAGDFYTLSKPYCIQDPLLIAGFWLGNETDQSASLKQSPFNLHWTDQSAPYLETEISGAYVWKNTVATSTTTPIDPNAGTVEAASFFSGLGDVSGGEWAWYYTDINSSVYGKEPSRWREVTTDVKIGDQQQVDASGNTVTITQIKKFKTATKTDFETWEKLKDIGFLRIELSLGGTAATQNWHDPILAKCWLQQGDKYFKILNQDNGNVIDVAIADVTGKVLFDITQKVTLMNQYAWMLNEHYMDAVFNGIFWGRISTKSFDATTGISTLTLEESYLSEGTFNNNCSFRPDYLNGVNSFYNRFRIDATKSIIKDPMLPLYTKGQNWQFVLNNKVYAVTKFAVVKGDTYFPSTITESYQVALKISGDISKETQLYGYITFDTPYERVSFAGVGGLFDYALTEGASSDIPPLPTLCLDASWLSAPIKGIFVSTGGTVGVCGGRYWGLDITGGLGHVLSESGNDILITTPYAVSGLSSFYHHRRMEDWVVYNDAYTNKITIRRGELHCIESPRKTEVTIGGQYVSNSVGNASTIILDSTNERLRAIRFTIPDAEKYSGESLMFSAKSPANYYGFLVSGKGDVDLQTLRSNDIKAGATPSTKYQFNGLVSSPIYVYKKSAGLCMYPTNTVEIGLSTTDSPIYIKDSDAKDVVVKNVTIEYVKDNQTLNSGNLFDVYGMADGEELLVYSAPIASFTTNQKPCNNIAVPNQWTNQSGIFITGTGDEALHWGCPLVKDLSFENVADKSATALAKGDYRFPLLVLPSSLYLGSIYHPWSHRLYIFARCNSSTSQAYIGCFSVGVNDLIYSLYKCVNTNKSSLDFLFRPLSLPSDLLTNSDLSYAVLGDLSNLPTEEKLTDGDTFARVIGVADTKSQIISADVINNIGTFLQQHGVLGFLYDSDSGIKIACSQDGINWKQPPIVVKKNAFSPFYIDGDLFGYITPSGIEVQTFTGISLAAAVNLSFMQVSEGNYVAYKEEVQRNFDTAQRVLIGTGPLDAQKITGYKTIDGLYRIFFYNQDQVLVCMESSDMLNWKTAANF